MPRQEDSMEDFGQLLEEQMAGFRTGFSPGEKVRGTVTAIGPEYVVVDLHAKYEGILPRHQVTDPSGELAVAPGEAVEAYFTRVSGGSFWLSTTFEEAAGAGSLAQAKATGMAVEGLVKQEVNGGYEIMVGHQRCFCPYSQIDLFRREAAGYLGQRYLFAIEEVEEDGKNVVLSRRKFLEHAREEKKAELRERLQVDDVVTGTVVKIMPFGVFVDLGGAEGLIPLGELAWGRRNQTPEAWVQEGERVSVQVMDIDWEQERISLSLRYAQGDPWETAVQRYAAGEEQEGTVTKLMPFGAFVELEPGIEGLIHISKLGRGRRLSHAKEVLTEGDVVRVHLDEINHEDRRISLSLALADGGLSAPVGDGDVIEGVVDSIRDFGVFVTLPSGETGLLHVSQTEAAGQGPGLRALQRRYSPGAAVQVVVKRRDGDRISLTTPEKWQEDAERDDYKQFMSSDRAGGLGSLGDALSGLDV